MPHKNWILHIDDIVEAIEKALAYVADMTFDQFTNDPKAVAAAIRFDLETP